jgi:Domain of unknown function (DUF1707)/Cell wall-active antibiotics response 4TMS YvqF
VSGEELRASDAERERVVSELREHHAAGRLTLDELAERTEAAYGARTRVELEPLTRDLPAERTSSPALPRRHARRFLVALFGGGELTGRWRLARHLRAITVFGGGDVDLRNAELPEEPATITMITLFGGSDVYVPEGLDVDLSGFAIFGGNDEHLAGPPLPPDAPLVRIRTFTLFGGNDVWRIPDELRDRPLRGLLRQVRKARRGLPPPPPPLRR